MSKNDQVHSQDPAIVGSSHLTIGSASLTQGVYGARGNLELVACDPDDGLWVFWFNSDLATDLPAVADVPPGRWSSGLQFATGNRYRDAVILQSTLGPDHLEVLALDEGGVLESWYWSPGPGFQRRSGEVARDVTAFAAVHESGTIRVTVQRADVALSHVVSDAIGYPDRAWRAAPDGPAVTPDDAARRMITATGVAPDDITQATARSCRSTRAGGTIELTWRDSAGALRHTGVPLPG